jgi:hypothetical protein
VEEGAGWVVDGNARPDSMAEGVVVGRHDGNAQRERGEGLERGESCVVEACGARQHVQPQHSQVLTAIFRCRAHSPKVLLTSVSVAGILIAHNVEDCGDGECAANRRSIRI